MEDGAGLAHDDARPSFIRDHVTLHRNTSDAALQAGNSDMAVPPGNRLEALKGNLAGFHSIRINDQSRIIFKWANSGPSEVSIVAYLRLR